MKLNPGEKHLLRLINSEAGDDGWAPVSATVLPFVEILPEGLTKLERLGNKGAGRVKLTDEGKSIIKAMEWL